MFAADEEESELLAKKEAEKAREDHLVNRKGPEALKALAQQSMKQTQISTLVGSQHLEGLRQILIQSNPDLGYETGGGDGILTVGGGKYWPGIFVMIRLARAVGWQGPIEVWFRGDCEQVYPEDVQGLGVRFFDLDEMGRRLEDTRIVPGNPGSGGWEAKLYAMMHTTLDRVLYLDADAYLVDSPETLFQTLNGKPFAYWRDLASQVRSIRWQYVWPNGDMGVMPVQGGQLLIDRRSAWQMIHAAHYMCQYSDYYFKHMYGDQDAWRVALAATGTARHEIARADWVGGVAFVCRQAGRDYVVHRCRGKLYAAEDIPPGRVTFANPQYDVLPREVEVFNLLAEVLNKRPRDSYDVFESIYAKKLWGPNSGAGAKMREAQPYVDLVNGLIQSKGWQSVADVGCGDGHVGSFIRGVHYMGVDVSESILERCRREHPENFYMQLDAYAKPDQIPAADVLLAKDVLHHWPNEWVISWLTRVLVLNRWKAILLCQDGQQQAEQQDCALGGFRPLSPSMAPLKDFPFFEIGKVFQKSVLLWESPDV